MARKLAETYWKMMVKRIEYAEFGVENYKEQLLKQKLKSAYRLTNELDLQLIPYQNVVIPNEVKRNQKSNGICSV